jgi:hypothetical protein
MLARAAATLSLLALASCSATGLPAGPSDLAGIDLGNGGGDGGQGGCNCSMGFQCCAGRCVNQANDILNCGACGKTCPGPHPFCEGGSCTQAQAVCNMQKPCGGGTFCCGTLCCGNLMLCCEVPGPGPSMGPSCVDPNQNFGSCPPGCPLCK